MKRAVLLIVLAAACLPTSGTGQSTAAQPSLEWKELVAERVPAFGHRNWIVIADSAYPAQTGGGIETVATNADHLTVVKAVLDELANARHVRPVVYLDAELPHVPEADAMGVSKYRDKLAKLLGDRKPQALPHEQIIAKLDKAGETFKVLVLKTDLALPYTSVFLELDCGYWSPEAELRLREAMKETR